MKIKKVAAIAACGIVMASAAVGLTACSGGAEKVEALGTYSYKEFIVFNMEAGSVINSLVENITIYSDNTYIATSLFDSEYSSQGSDYSTVMYSYCVFSGTYELVSEDTEFNSKTIKITDVQEAYTDIANPINVADYIATLEGEEATKATELMTTVKAEMTLTADCKMSHNLSNSKEGYAISNFFSSASKPKQ